MRKVYVGNLPDEADEKAVETMFSEFGKVDAVGIPESTGDQENRFAFVDMDRDADADRAINELHGKEIDGHKLVVNFATTGTVEPDVRA
jgi:RNA recognition motif-containing protein